MWSTNQYDLFNMHGARLCGAVGCRKHKRLYWIGREYFCQQHADQMICIRTMITNIKQRNDRDALNNIHSEITLRQSELALRKRSDAAHYHFLFMLENKYNEF